MNNDIQIFCNSDFGTVRVVQKDDEPWFMAADVCRALDIGNPTQALTRLDVDEVTLISNEGGREVNFVNEPGLYSLVLGSRKPEAKAFRRWITHEVIPSIRKHGAYMTPETLQAAILNPDYLLQVVTALKDETDKRKALEAQNARLVVDNQILQPKADYFDELVDRNTLTNFRETAKELGIPPRKFTTFLLDKKYIYRDKRGKLLPYENKNNGLFEVKETFNEKTQWSGTQTLVTAKGRETFRTMGI